MKIVLASKSPRRKELLSMLDLQFEIITADIDETLNPDISVCDAVSYLSYQKAAAVAEKVDQDTVIISADTVVEYGGKIFGKPKDEFDAEKTLKLLSGNTHNVFTGVTVLQGKKSLTETVKTEVSFRDISDSEISAYIKSREPMNKTGGCIRYSWEDKAGGYGIQEPFGMKYIESIHGDFYNVVGLPLSTLSRILKNEFGVNI